MSSSNTQYLQEMGIDNWELTHPERLANYQAPRISLPEECRLLFIAAACPTGADAVFFEKILKAMSLELKHARHIEPHQVAQLDDTEHEWVWFAGCEVVELPSAKKLTSPVLSDIESNPQNKRALWQQIQAQK